MIEIISAIQKAKASLLSTKSFDLNERKAWLQRFSLAIDENQNKIIELEKINLPGDSASHTIWTIESAKKCIENLLFQMESQEQNFAISFRPTGLISLFLPSYLSLRSFCERGLPALAAGNSLVVKVSSKCPEFAVILRQLLDSAGVPSERVGIITNSRDVLGSLLFQHPAIRAVIFVGSSLSLEEQLRGLPANVLVTKKIQAALSSNNSAIVVGDNWSQSSLEKLADACYLGGGLLPWNITKIFVSDVHIEKFKKSFLPLIESRQCQARSDSQIASWTEKLHEIQRQSARVLCGGSIRDHYFRPALIEDLSHCSEIQQEPMSGPVVLLSGVKYPLDAVKWANTGSLSQLVMLVGDFDKIPNWVYKLEAGTISINRGFEVGDGLLVGGQQSNLGSTDLRIFGTFYSDCKKIVGQTSKI